MRAWAQIVHFVLFFLFVSSFISTFGQLGRSEKIEGEKTIRRFKCDPSTDSTP